MAGIGMGKFPMGKCICLYLKLFKGIFIIPEYNNTSDKLTTITSDMRAIKSWNLN